MTGPKVDIGRDLVAFVSSQGAFTIADAAGESYPEAADAVRVITGSSGGTIAYNPREDKFGTATAVPGIQQKRTAEGSLEGYAMPSGTRTTIPDIGADLLVKGGWEIVDASGTDEVVSGSSSTTTTVDMTDSSGFSVGDPVMVEDTVSGSGIYEMRRISAVNSGTPNDIVVEPPLTFSPAASANVKGAIGYKPSDTRDTSEDCLTLWMLNNNSADRLGAWTPASFNFTMGGDDAARFTASGTARRHDRLFQTPLASNLTTSTTTMVVTDALASSGDTLNTYWTLSDGGNTAAEVVKVTAISGTSWTVTRGAIGGFPDPGSTWDASDTVITPYRPTGTYAGSPVPATSGQIVMAPYGGTTATSLQCNSTSLDCGMAVAYREDEQGDAYKVSGYTMSQRDIRATLSGWSLRTTNMAAEMQAFQTTNVAGDDSQQITVAVVVGQTEGAMFGWVAPRLRSEDLSLDRGAEEVTLELTGRCEGTSSGADEILLMFG